MNKFIQLSGDENIPNFKINKFLCVMRKKLLYIMVAVVACVGATENVCAQPSSITPELTALRNFLIQDSYYVVRGDMNNPALADAANSDVNRYPTNYHCISGQEADRSVKFGLPPNPSDLIDKLKHASDWQNNPTFTDWVTQVRGPATNGKISFDGSGYITAIDWTSGKGVMGICAGTLDLSLATRLTKFVSTMSQLTELSLSGTGMKNKVIDIQVNGNLLTKFNIEGGTELVLGVPALKVLVGSTFNCRNNRLTFNNMPKMRIMAPQPGDFPNDASNFYYCSSQAVFVKSGGDPYDAVNIANLYGVSLGPFTTSYAWYSNSGMTTPITPPSGSNGSYTFPSSMLGNTIYCKVKNPLFSLKTSDRSFVPFPGYKYSTEYPYNSLYDYGEEFYAPNYIASYAGECDLVLCYQTTLGLPTSITNPTAPSLIAYFSGEMLNITNNEISLQSVSIFDLSGKQLFASNFNDTGITVDGAGWQKGVYIIKATSDAGVFTQKIIKNF